MAINNELELLVALQDLDMMIEEISEVKRLGFSSAGEQELINARDDLASRISKPLVYSYEKLKKRYKRAIVRVKEDNTCLGCFIKLPTSMAAIGRTDKAVIYCESCGRMLYWLF